MTRRLQHRDISEPIERIVREHLNQLGVAAIHHGPIARELTSEMNDVVTRAMSEAYREGRNDAATAIRAANTSGWPGGRGSDVDGCQEAAARIAESEGR